MDFNINKNIIDILNDLDILNNRKTNIESLLKLLVKVDSYDIIGNFIKNMEIKYNDVTITIDDFIYDNDENFLFNTYDCIDNDYYVTKNGIGHYNYKYNLGDILDNIQLNMLDNNTLYNYVIIKDDNNKYIFRLGKVTESAQLGVKHSILGINATKYLAGKIKKIDNKIEYNFESSGFGVTKIIADKLRLNNRTEIDNKKVSFNNKDDLVNVINNVYKKLIENILKQLDNTNNYNIVFNDDYFSNNRLKKACFSDGELDNINKYLKKTDNCIDLMSKIDNKTNLYIKQDNYEFLCKNN